MSEENDAIEFAKREVLWGCETMNRRGYVLGSAGNISARVKGTGLFVITPSGIPYDELKYGDLVVADMAGNIVEGTRKPSIEFSMHRSILLKRPDVNAVVHTHSKYATAAGAVKGILEVPAVDIETVLYIGGNIKVAPFAPPGSEALEKTVSETLGNLGGLILESHGAMGVGQDMKKALTACDNVERTCEMYLLIRAVGEMKPLPEDYFTEASKKSLVRRGCTPDAVV